MSPVWRAIPIRESRLLLGGPSICRESSLTTLISPDGGIAWLVAVCYSFAQADVARLLEVLCRYCRPLWANMDVVRHDQSQLRTTIFRDAKFANTLHSRI